MCVPYVVCADSSMTHFQTNLVKIIEKFQKKNIKKKNKKKRLINN